MSNFKQQSFEWPIHAEARGGHFDGLVLLAKFEVGHGGVGPYVSFEAEYRGLIYIPSARMQEVKDLNGCEYRRRLPPGPAFYATHLEQHETEWALGSWIRAITKNEIAGDAAERAVWTIFFRLVLANPKYHKWIDKLDDTWLSGLCKESVNA